MQKYHNTPFKDLVTIELHVYAAILESLKQLSEEQLAAHKLFERITQATITHYRRHAADIRKRFKAPLKH